METIKHTVLCPGCGAINPEGAGFCSSCGGEIGPDAVRILPAQTTLDQGRYTITGYVGRGGSAITYRAKQRNFTSEIVLREYYPSLTAKREEGTSRVIPLDPSSEMPFDRGKHQFRMEGDRLRSLRDIPNIVTVYDVFEDNNTVYMVEDYIRGESLQTFLAREGKLSFRQAMQIMGPVMKALAAVHSHDIIHRDVKPSNIMVENGVPCLIDFGISRKILETTTLSADSEKKIRTIASSYTMGYAAPEQITGEERETRAVDVYGAAATLYRMVTGLSPDDAGARLRNDFLTSPLDAGAVVSELQSDIIMQGLSLSVTERFQSMQVFLNLLEDSMKEPAGRKPPVRKPPVKEPSGQDGEKNGKALYMGAGVLAGLCLICLVLLLLKVMPGLSGSGKAPESSAATSAGAGTNPQAGKDASPDASSGEEAAQEGLLNLVSWNGSTYGFYDMEKAQIRNFDDIVYFASQMGAYPAVIDSYEENIFLYNQTLKTGAVSAYFGLHCGIGENSWTWPEGQDTEYVHWAKEEPGTEKGAEGFARFTTYFMNGFWESGSLNAKYPLIMEWDRVLDTARVLEGPENIFDIATFTYGNSVYAIYNMSSYGLNTIKVQGVDNEHEEFAYMVDFCRARGGYLAVINDEKENDFLFGKVMETDEDSAFFGYTDWEEEGNWKWVDRDSSYVNWAPGQPNNGVATPDGTLKFGEDYGQFFHSTKDGTWNDSKIHINTRAFIVEWDK